MGSSLTSMSNMGNIRPHVYDSAERGGALPSSKTSISSCGGPASCGRSLTRRICCADVSKASWQYLFGSSASSRPCESSESLGKSPVALVDQPYHCEGSRLHL